jgi:murein DD-endopeptidase MepM/ murein hydrolase activator NlpD
MSKIIVGKTSEDSSPITLDDPNYSVGNDDGQTLMSRMSTAFIRKRGKYENNTGPTAQVLKKLTAEPSWFQKTLTNLGITEKGSTLYLCRIISDHRTSGCPEPVSIDDNITDLHFTRFILPGDADGGMTLNPGAIVRVRMDDNSTDIPKPGGDARTTVEGCSANTAGGSSGRKIKIATTKPPRPTRGEFPRSPITGKKAVDSDGTRTLSRDERIEKIGKVNSGFPTRNSSPEPHKGVDLRTTVNGVISTGAPVKAALDGHAVIGTMNGYGYVVAVKHTAYKAPTV